MSQADGPARGAIRQRYFAATATGRRSLLRDSTALAVTAAGLMGRPALGQAFTSPQEDWAEFRRRFLHTDGRIIDTGNRNVSHSEGQGYGLLGAVRADDQGSFGRILTWTLGNLKRREDNLCSWRFQPDQTPAVADPNNATDGDLLIAWALLEAADRWQNIDYRRRALAIGRDLLRSCTVQRDGRWLLLPGAYGFQSRTRFVLNLSYYVFPALRALAREASDPVWQRLDSDAIALMRQTRFGRFGLPPDWLEVKGPDDLQPANGWPARFSFDAVRIPLNLAWAGHADHPVVTAAVGFWVGPDQHTTPAWTDLRSGQTAPFPASSGVIAIARFAAAAMLGRGNPTVMPRIASAPDYYAAALVMQSRMAWRDRELSVTMR